MLVRVLPPLALLALTACPSFAVGPEAYPLPSADEAACEAAGLSADMRCSPFELDNGQIYDAELPQPVLLRFGFESTERNLDYVTLSYEHPGLPPVEQSFDFGVYATEPQGSGMLRCYGVVLAGTTADELAPVDTAAQGILGVDLDILADEPGAYAISAWLTDDNGFESAPVRWQFNVLEPQRE